MPTQYTAVTSAIECDCVSLVEMTEVKVKLHAGFWRGLWRYSHEPWSVWRQMSQASVNISSKFVDPILAMTLHYSAFFLVLHYSSQIEFKIFVFLSCRVWRHLCFVWFWKSKMEMEMCKEDAALLNLQNAVPRLEDYDASQKLGFLYKNVTVN